MGARTFPASRLTALPLFFLVALLSLAQAAQSESYENRVAVVLGVSNYGSPDRFDLPNAAADVEGVSRQLGELGFKVQKYLNPRADQLPSILLAFRDALSPGAIAFFYFSGHGFQSEGQNYLLLDPVPTTGLALADVKRSSLALNEVVSILERARTQINVVLLDACRIPPAKGIVTTGLAEVVAPINTVLGFATYPGGVALQFDDDRFSLYTKFLVPNMSSSGQTIEQVLKNVGKSVFTATKGEKKPQQPWMQSSLYEDFYLVQNHGLKTRGNEKGDIEQWYRIRDSRETRDFEEYMARFPGGFYTLQAKQKIRVLSNEGPTDSTLQAAGAALDPWLKNRELLSGKGLFERLDDFVAANHDPLSTLKLSAQKGNEVGLAMWCTLLTHERYRLPVKIESEWPLCNQKALLSTPVGMFIAGRAMYFGRGTSQDRTAGIRLIYSAANAGNPLAANFLGDLQFNAQKPDCNSMKKFYFLAAKAGDANAFNNLGVAHLMGRCFLQDPYEARLWFRKAASSGNAWAATNLGMMLLTGKGGTPDLDEGFSLISSAADKGNAQAWVLLGKYFESGLNGRPDFGKARHWYSRVLNESGESDLLEFARLGLGRLPKAN